MKGITLGAVFTRAKKYSYKIGLTLLLSTSTAAGSEVNSLDDLNNCEVTRNFGEVAFGTDNLNFFAEVLGSEVINKWGADPIWLRIGVENESDGILIKEILVRTLVEIIELTGIEFVPEENQETNGEIRIFVGSVGFLIERSTAFMDFDGNFPAKPFIESLRDHSMNKDRICFVYFGRNLEEVNTSYATVFIHNEAMDVQVCVWEEMFQTMGLPRDSNNVPFTLFSEFSEFSEPTDQDRLFLKVLYDERIQSGMTRSEALPVVRQILSELRPDFDEC